MYETGVSNTVMGTAISAISIYHITDGNMGHTVGKYPLVTRAKKAIDN